MASPEHGDALRGARQVDFGDAPLRLESLGQVCVRVQSDAVGPQLAHLLHRSREALGRLPGKPVDEICVDGEVAQLPGTLHQSLHHLERLNAVDRLLHLGIEVLNPEAEAVEAERAEVRQSFGRHGARVDLDRDLGVRRQPERRRPVRSSPGRARRRTGRWVSRHRSEVAIPGDPCRATRPRAPAPSRAPRGSRQHVRGAW